MTPEYWQQVKLVLDAALDLPRSGGKLTWPRLALAMGSCIAK